MPNQTIAIVTPMPYFLNEKSAYPMNFARFKGTEVLQLIEDHIDKCVDELVEAFKDFESTFPSILKRLITDEMGNFHSKNEIVQIVKDTVISLIDANLPENVAEALLPVPDNTTGAMIFYAVCTLTKGEYDENFARLELLDWMRLFYEPLKK